MFYVRQCAEKNIENLTLVVDNTEPLEVRPNYDQQAKDKLRRNRLKCLAFLVIIFFYSSCSNVHIFNPFLYWRLT